MMMVSNDPVNLFPGRRFVELIDMLAQIAAGRGRRRSAPPAPGAVRGSGRAPCSSTPASNSRAFARASAGVSTPCRPSVSRFERPRLSRYWIRIGLDPAWLHPQPETRQIVIPIDDVIAGVLDRLDGW